MNEGQRIEGAQMGRHIEIEPGSTFIAAGELGRRIGALLCPLLDTPPLLVSLQKKIPEAEPKNFRIEELTDADLLYLRAAWKGINVPDALNMTPEQWAQCKAAFQAAPDRPAWELVAGFRDYANEAKSEQYRIANKHIQAINALILSGRMRAYDADLVPVQKVDGWKTQILVDEARAYLEPLGFDLVESAPAAEDAGPGTPAEQWDDAKRDMPRKHELADAMVKRCQGNKKKAARRLGTTTGPLYRALNWKPQHCGDSSVASVAPMYAQLAEEPHKT
jgi:hypothetical protein